jgi:integrase
MKQNLNDPIIKNTKPSDKTQKLSDGGGLFLYVEPNGSKRWRYRFQFEGKEQLLSLGLYPDITLKQARLERDTLKTQINAGINPAAQRKAEKTTPDGYHPNCFEIVAREWYNERKNTWSKSTADHIISRLERNIFPWIGKKDIAQITAPEVLTVIRRIKDRGLLHTAHKTMQNCGQVFRYGVQTGKCERDVTHDLRGALPAHETRHMASFTEPKDVKRLLQSFDDYTGSYPVQCALKLSVLWFVRPSELRLARWADIDLDNGEWRFVVSKTKTPHIVPLSTQAIAILRDLHALTGHYEYVFAINKDAPMSDATVNKALRRLGWDTQTEYTGHGARSMARTILAERLKVQPEIIEHQLAHRVPDSLGTAYNRTKYLDDRKIMMQAWGDYLDELKASATIIKFRA